MAKLQKLNKITLSQFDSISANANELELIEAPVATESVKEFPNTRGLTLQQAASEVLSGDSALCIRRYSNDYIEFIAVVKVASGSTSWTYTFPYPFDNNAYFVQIIRGAEQSSSDDTGGYGTSTCELNGGGTSSWNSAEYVCGRTRYGIRVSCVSGNNRIYFIRAYGKYTGSLE